MSYSYKQDREKNVPGIASPTKSGPTGLNVLKRNGSIQPFDKNKLVASISKAGATQKQALLVSDRVANRLGGSKQPVPTSQLSTMVARSLGQVNPLASSKFTAYRERKLSVSPAATAKGAVLSRKPVISAAGLARVSAQAATTQKVQITTVRAATQPTTSLRQTSKLPTRTTEAPTRPAAPSPTIPTVPPQPSASTGSAIPLQSAVTRIGPSSQTVPLPTLLEILKQQPPSQFSTMAINPAALLPEQYQEHNDLEAIAFNWQQLKGTQGGAWIVEVFMNPTTHDAVLEVRALLRRIKKDSKGWPISADIIKKTGLLTYKYYFFSEHGTWPEEKQTVEAMEDGVSATLFRFVLPGVYEFTIAWSGDQEIPPLTSNTVRITIKENP